MGELKRVFIEVVVVAVVGLVVGLGANAMNPDGINLTRDYFRMGMTRPDPGSAPRTTQPVVQAAAGNADADPGQSGVSATTQETTSGAGGAGQGTAPSATGDSAESTDKVAEALKAWGLNPIHFDEAKRLHEDLLYEAGVFIFVDARDDAHYTAAHITGAYQIDYYFIERYIDTVLPLVQGAEKVVVYCNGGDCEDSKLVADALRNEHAIDPLKLLVYVGGMEEWKAKDMPVEKGERGSGDITGGGK